ncbi:MAG TPA: PD-(D/E)XK nuclease family protein [Pyrinomonadaceae bacterium]|jgi:putative RecB family exonuclease|nr:PD-(D/E)XK nuclease family protein [Pyrinomonadaceae bacterium]
MTIASSLKGWTVPRKTDETRIRRYSTTGDILAYKRCRRQYGYFGVRGFASATATQRYFGTLVHDVLDRINRDYRINPVLPDKTRVDELVEEAHERLLRSGIRPYNSRQQRDRASRLIHRFVLLIGPHFFRHVMETEYRLERALQTHMGRDYILNGIVDVLSGAVSHALNLPYSTEPDDIEIWDYKAASMPDKHSPTLQDYIYQMRVYAELYRQQTGEYPARAVLVFLGELDDDKRWDSARLDPSNFPRLVYPIYPTPKHVDVAIADFHQTVEFIEAERAKPYDQQWHAPTHPVDLQMCEVCELRYNCTNFIEGAKQRTEAL